MANQSRINKKHQKRIIFFLTMNTKALNLQTGAIYECPADC
jgi:hypothetical protein